MKDSASRKLDGPPEPPPHVWASDQAWARVLTSTPPRESSGEHGGPPSIIDDVITKGAGISYAFDLEIHRPGQGTYTISRKTRVPSKVEGAVFGSTTTVPVGAEVPLQVNGPDAEDVELDWDAYLEIPYQADRTYHLHVKAGRASVAKNVSPEIQRQSAQAVTMLAQGVAQGTMTRDMFDQQVASLQELGYLRDEDLHAALAIIDG